jgi:hypothetical protein
MMCLAKDPANRLPSAESLARMLEDTDAANSWTAENAKCWWNENMPGDVALAEAAEQPTL